MNIDTLRKRLTIEEGDHLVAYHDSEGILTVGRGHNCVDEPVPGVTKVGDCITPEQDEALFQKDISDACKDLDAFLPWWRKLDDARQNVMIDMCFNMGIEGLLTFKNTLLSIKNGDYESAANRMGMSLWATQVKSRATFLIGAMRTGVYE